jgi:hypothetical protein
MESLVITLQSDTETRIRRLVSFDLSPTDVEWFADWLMMVGLSTVDAAQRQRPELTLGDLIRVSFRLYD